MRGKSRSLVLALGATVAALCTSACQKSAREDPPRTGTAELHAAEQTIDPQPATGSEPNGYLAAVRREQLDLRSRLQDELDELDEQIAEPQAGSAARTRVQLERRGKLAAFLTAVDHADERGWDLLKATVERELADKPDGKI